MLYEGEGERLKALRQYKIVVQLEPNNSEALAALDRIRRSTRKRRLAN